MRIGLNLLYLIPSEVGGTETYARGLLHGLKRIQTHYEFILFLNRESEDLLAGDDRLLQKVICPVNATNRKKRYLFEQFMLRRYVKDYRIQLLHSLAYTSPIYFPCPTVVSLPDLNFKALGRMMTLQRRMMLRLIVRQAVLRSNKVVTISSFSREEILNNYHIPAEKVVVTHLAADNHEFDAQSDDKPLMLPGLPDLNVPYILVFSSSTANKNLARVIEAFLQAKKVHGLTHKLLLVGHHCAKGNGPQIACRNSDVHWTGYLERGILLAVLKRAEFMVFASFYEGFGLPVLEAMAAGVPVVCSRSASLPEIAGDASIFFDPYSVDEMAASIALVAGDPKLRQTMRQKGIENAERFSWAQTARQTVGVYDEILKRV